MKSVASNANAMFGLLDRDGGGSVDSKELAAGLFRLGVWLHPEELKSLFSVLDQVFRPPKGRPDDSLFKCFIAPIIRC